MKDLLTVLLWTCCVCLSASEEVTIVVQTKNGGVNGKMAVSFLSQLEYFTFKGIPYAEPPLGELRFQPPRLPPYSYTILDALEFGPKCPQNSPHDVIEGDENCLYLNVYTPDVPRGDRKFNKSVMVFVHGGGFSSGSGDDFLHGPDFLLEMGVVLVTFNYRLGALGFLALEDRYVTGNMGLKDQVAALTWVQNNIEYFGGNPAAVTIFGHEAGSMSVHYLMLSPSPIVQGLFYRAICQSGTALNPLAMSINPRNTAFELGKILGIDTNNQTILLHHLRKMSAHDLVNASSKIPQNSKLCWWNQNPPPFLPCLELQHGEEENRIILNLLEDGLVSSIPLMIGFASQEILHFISDDLEDPERLEEFDANFNVVLPKNGVGQTNESLKVIREYYFKNESINNETVEDVADMLSDIYFVYGIDTAAKIHAENLNSSTYYYRFSYYGWLNKFKLSVDTELYGASNGDEICYLFYCRSMAESYEELDEDSDDVVMIRRMTKLWTNFAKYGNPTPERDELLGNVVWPQMTPQDVHFLDIDDRLSPAKRPEYARMNFWNKYFQNKHDEHEENNENGTNKSEL